MKTILFIIALSSYILTISASDKNIHLNFDKERTVKIPWKNSRFDAHFSGLEIGMNNYVNNSFKLQLDNTSDFMDIGSSKSWGVNINLAELNFAIIDKHLGLTTGLKFQFNNYKFSKNLTLDPESNPLDYILETDITYKKSKLTTTYLSLPLFFEIQIPMNNNTEIFHVSLGAEAGIKLGSHTKVVYEENNQKIKDKVRDDFNTNLFRYGLIAKVGYDDISVFANYSLQPLFEENKGPELYPFMIGLAFSF